MARLIRRQLSLSLPLCQPSDLDRHPIQFQLCLSSWALRHCEYKVDTLWPYISYSPYPSLLDIELLNSNFPESLIRILSICAYLGTINTICKTHQVNMTSPTLTIELKNATTSNTVFAYVTGTALDSGNSLWLLQSDGASPYFPVSPANTQSPLAVNCAIPLGPPGSTRPVTVPHLAGARIWFCVDGQLTFLLNPGKNN
jgi:hypothetical protein